MPKEQPKGHTGSEEAPEKIVLASSFKKDAHGYDLFRPGYPETLFDRMIQVAELTSDARLLEIGCGTGKATLPLAKRGYDITAVEPVESLIALASITSYKYPSIYYSQSQNDSVKSSA
jgi:2-polyprenyl-3-methyl-5-hydroxy-6-metoxy-1,4-benzoquinol methylase